MDVSAGFQITTFPIKAGALARFPAIAVKLNGGIAAQNPFKKKRQKIIKRDE